MNVISCFDGMSCGQIALERAGITVDNYFASEIDKAAMKVTMKNYPNTVQLGSIKSVSYNYDSIEVQRESGSWLTVDKCKVDLLIGGSPCQGFSFAGKQLNFNDDRSRLFFEYVRLWEQLKRANPELLFLLENVRMKKEYEQVISNILGVRPIRLNSSLVSAQNRERLYWTNIPVDTIPVNKNIKLNDILEPGFYADRDKSYCLDANYGKGTNFRRYFFCGSRQLVLQNNYYPENLTKETANEIMHRDGNRWRKLTVNECEKLQTVPINYTEGVPIGERYKMLGNGWTVDIVAFLLKHIGLKPTASLKTSLVLENK